jgi:hypothetical protein
MDKDRVYLGIGLNKNFLWTAVLTTVWFTVGTTVGIAILVGLIPLLLLMLIGFTHLSAMFITYWIVRKLRSETVLEDKTVNYRSRRVQRWLELLDDDELDALRDRLQADESERTLEELLVKQKRH